MAHKDEIGTFAWYSLMTTDVEKTLKFYSELVGWTVSEMEFPGMGKSSVFSAQGRPFAAPVPMTNMPGIPSHWAVFITVDDVDAACARAEKLGGKVCNPAFDMPGIGRTAVLTDPAGAMFHPFVPEDKSGAVNVMGDGEGQICWNELMVAKTQDAAAFYSEMVGWKMKDQDMGMSEPYRICHVGEKMVAGLMPPPPEAAGMPPMWMPYVGVADVEAKTKQAEELGGKVIMPKTVIPNIGEFSLIEDTAGCVTYLFKG